MGRGPSASTFTTAKSVAASQATTRPSYTRPSDRYTSTLPLLVLQLLLLVLLCCCTGLLLLLLPPLLVLTC
jgi:hypothetical protein